MRIAIAAASLTLAACSTHAQPSSTLNLRLDSLIGQPVQAAVARLGEPAGEAPVGAGKVYGWRHVFTSTEVRSPAAVFIDPADHQGGVFPPPRFPVQNDCVVRMVVGADGLIQEWDYRGNERGCRAYADRLAGNAMARNR